MRSRDEKSDLMKKKTVVFAPHPDDETLGCGGTIAKRISEGDEVKIVVMTDGRHAFLKVLGIESDPTPEELALIRRKEVTNAARTLGLQEENILFLGFEDGTLDIHEKEAEEKVKEILQKYRPVEVFYPYKKDYNPDHRAANCIIRKSLEELGLTPKLYQYSIAQTFSRIGPLIAMLLNPFRKNLVYVDVSRFFQLKELAIEELKSQTSIISNRQKKPLIEKVDKFLKTKEMFYVDK